MRVIVCIQSSFDKVAYRLLRGVFTGWFLIAVFSVSLCGQNKRNLLADYHTPKLIATSVDGDLSWVTYPAYIDRQSWNEISKKVGEVVITAGEQYRGYEWPTVTVEAYLNYIRTGMRGAAQRIIGARQRALRTLFFAELMEGEGRFLDDLMNGVFSFCEQTTWEVPSRFYLYGFEGSITNPTTILPDVSKPIIGLTSSDIAADLSWILYFFEDEFDKISPVISRRLKYELKKKILEPFYASNDFWWITG